MSDAQIKLSIVVPVLNEAASVSACWKNIGIALHECGCLYEVIFVDGGSRDETVDIINSLCSPWPLIEMDKNESDPVETSAHRADCRLVRSGKGRAKQMNAGAALCRGESIVFLHVDTRLPVLSESALEQITQVDWGFFLVALDNQQRAYRVISQGINFRSRVFKVATGDQCIFAAREFYFSQGGFSEIPLMEDIEFTRRMLKLKTPLIVLDKAITSARRWEKYGVVKTVLLMWMFQLAFRLGVSPARLAKMY
ncbi:Undecaprenyl-phosphate 4-deoxy-4-formamido-L-arabinose transferase [Thalassocella blandensis]|nr:Undecaprenyl-phosphate 4-deoxy-4-formamido-L-arabinose transferase [Thalassocella blandensis]